VDTAPVVELGRAMMALLSNELPEAPKGEAWLFGTPDGRSTIRMDTSWNDRIATFDKAWLAVSRERNGESVSPQLRTLLEAVYLQILTEPLDRATLKGSLEELLFFLSAEGRTNANCWATDLFFALDENWETDWSNQNLTADLHDILAMMGQALHDTIQAPEIARNFGCLPEQLLERIRQLPD